MLALGLWGEEEALKYLISKGYTLLERNYRFKKWSLILS